MSIALDDLKRCQAKLANCEDLLLVALRNQFEYLDMPELGIGRRPWKEAALAAREGIKTAEERQAHQEKELVEARRRTAGANKRTADVAQQATAWEETCVSAKRQRDDALVALKQSGIDAAELLAERDQEKKSSLENWQLFASARVELSAAQKHTAELEGDCEELRTDLEHRCSAIGDLEAALEQERSQGLAAAAAGGAIKLAKAWQKTEDELRASLASAMEREKTLKGDRSGLLDTLKSERAALASMTEERDTFRCQAHGAHNPECVGCLEERADEADAALSPAQERVKELEAEIERHRDMPGASQTAYLIEQDRRKQQVAYWRARDKAARAALVQRDEARASLSAAQERVKELEGTLENSTKFRTELAEHVKAAVKLRKEETACFGREIDALKAQNARLLIRACEAEKLVRPAQNISGVPDTHQSQDWNSGYRQRQREEWSRALNSETRAREAEAKLAGVQAAIEEGDDDGS